MFYKEKKFIPTSTDLSILVSLENMDTTTDDCERCTIRQQDDCIPVWSKLCDPCYRARKEKRDTAGYRQCSSCKQSNICQLEPSWKTTCGPCYVELAKTLRPCKICGENRIAADRPDWMNVCGKCYVQGKESARLCKQCNQPSIMGYEPSWKVTCGKCYKAKIDNNKNK